MRVCMRYLWLELESERKIYRRSSSSEELRSENGICPQKWPMSSLSVSHLLPM